jgi:osmoprotectant transport system ATP-binding protein
MIALERVSKSFDRGASFAVRQVSLEVPAHSFLAVVGESGSGKTTLLKLINRLIEPDEGDISIAGQPANSLPPHTLRRRMGYVFQGIGLFPHMSIAENIGITPRLVGWPEPQIRARVAELLDLVSLPRPYLTRRPAELSGGQRQRVGIARALAARPDIMLMDEPFGALDPVTRDALGGEYRRLHDDMGLTTVMVTHDVMEAVLLAAGRCWDWPASSRRCRASRSSRSSIRSFSGSRRCAGSSSDLASPRSAFCPPFSR